jgi:ribonuclease E
MEENKNRNSIEKKLKEAMRKDRARIQIGEISNFGLLELSRQRLRPSVVESSSELCSHCGGSGRIQSIEVSAVQILRAIEEEGSDEKNIGINIHSHSNVILHILNNKRVQLSEIETRYNIAIEFINDNSLLPPLKKIETIQKPNLNKPNLNKPNLNKPNPETVENKELIINDEDENQKRKKRGRRIGRRKQRFDDQSSIENSIKEEKIDEETSSISNQPVQNEVIKTQQPKRNYKKKNNSQNKDNDFNEKNQIDNNVTIENNKNIVKKTIATKNKKIRPENSAQEKTYKEEVKNDKIVELREIKTSVPIDVVKVDEVSNSKKPKKKGWWST